MALKGIKVVEMLGLAPGPFCGTILADFGASVIVVQKLLEQSFEVMSNGKRVISVDLKTKEGVDIVKKLCRNSDVLLDTYRPGVMEKLGLGPDTLMKDNTKLIYSRLTGYGQNGTYMQKAGHDINYIAMSGVLSMLRRNNQPPYPPVNLIADFGGGSLTCALGIILALFERSKSGKGQVVDCSMTEGAAYLSSWLFKSKSLPLWLQESNTCILNGDTPWYSIYETKDGKYMVVGCMEPQFYENFLKGLGLSAKNYEQYADFDRQRKDFSNVFIQKTQKEWCKIFDDLDACVTPVLDSNDADQHPCHVSRESFFADSTNLNVPNPAPKLSRTPGQSSSKIQSPKHGQHTLEVLRELGYSKDNIDDLINRSCVYAIKNSKL